MHKFTVNNEEYILSWETNGGPIITKNGINQKVLPILRIYISESALPIPLKNRNGNMENTYQIARKTLDYFNGKTKRGSLNNSKNQNQNINIPVTKSLYLESYNLEPLVLTQNYKIVIICASGKNKSRFSEFDEVNFVDNPSSNEDKEFHPDDLKSNIDGSWRNFLNNKQDDSKLLEAFKLYKRNEYRNLQAEFNDRFFILSAGWGLVKADYKLPGYDITFSTSNNVPVESRRKKKEDNRYKDFNALKNVKDGEDIIFIGSQHYLPLFIHLTANLKNRKVVYHYGDGTTIKLPTTGNFIRRRYNSNNPRAWYYDCATDFCNGLVP